MARPQAVAATVTKPDWMKVQAAAIHKSYSFDSTGSTASLVSVLDHDSYVESDSEIQEADIHTSHNSQQQDVYNTSFEDFTQSIHPKEDLEHVTRDGSQDDFNDNVRGISPWEKWLVEKEKEKRKRLQMEKAKKTFEEISQIDKEQMKLQKKMQINQNTFRWIQEKNLSEKLQIRQKRDKLKAAMLEEAHRKHEISEKANRNFEEWLKRKRDEEKAVKKAETERKQKEAESKKKKQALAKEKYDEWKKRAVKTLVKPTTNGWGHLSGKLTDCHDPTAYPPPSFYNPIPWKPLSIPYPKIERKPKTSKSFTKRK